MRKPDQTEDRLSDDQLAEMVAVLRSQAYAQRALNGLVEAHRARKAARSVTGEKRPADDLLELAQRLWAARRITQEELAYLASHGADRLNWERERAGEYKAELDPIEARMKGIEQAHGLAPDEYWGKADAPEEYTALTDNWEAVVDRHMGAILGELGFDAFAKLMNEDRPQWDRMVVAGRRLFHTRSELDPADTVRLLIDNYEREAALCEAAGAYYAGCVMLGAAAEARLLNACLEDREVSERARRALPKNRGPRKSDPHVWTLEQLIAIAVEAGWIGELQDTDFIFMVSGLADRVRATRNFLHPGRHATDRPLSPLTEHEYRDAKASYYGLRLALEQRATGAYPADGA